MEKWIGLLYANVLGFFFLKTAIGKQDDTK